MSKAEKKTQISCHIHNKLKIQVHGCRKTKDHTFLIDTFFQALYELVLKRPNCSAILAGDNPQTIGDTLNRVTNYVIGYNISILNLYADWSHERWIREDALTLGSYVNSCLIAL